MSMAWMVHKNVACHILPGMYLARGPRSQWEEAQSASSLGLVSLERFLSGRLKRLCLHVLGWSTLRLLNRLALG